MPVLSAASGQIEAALGRLFDCEQELINDPWPVFAALREHQPIARIGPLVVVSRYHDVKASPPGSRNVQFHQGQGVPRAAV